MARRPFRDSSAIYVSLVIYLATAIGVVCATGVLAVSGIASAAHFLVAAGVALIVATKRGVYRARMVPDVTSMASRLCQASVAGSTVAYVLGFLVIGSEYGPLQLFLVWFLLTAVLVLGLFVGTHALKRLWSAGILRSKAVVIGTGRLMDELLLELRHRRSYGVDVVGVAHMGALSMSTVEANADIPHVMLHDLEELCVKHAVDRVIIGPTTSEEAALVKAARWAAGRQIAVFVVPRLFEMGVGLDSLSPDRVRGYPLVRVQRSSHPRVALVAKRALDVLVSSTALLALSPVMLICALAVRVSSPGPILFKQERVGSDGKLITVAKFRSMAVNDGSDVEWTAEKRVTPIGNFLRRSSLDELPQFFAILRGDMSLVGPRPERPVFVEEFSQRYENYDDRHRMRGGLTGLAQVVGLVGDTSIEERIKYDNLYIDQWSFGGDIQIMIKTAWAVIRQSSKKQEHKELELVLSEPSAINDSSSLEPVAAQKAG